MSPVHAGHGPMVPYRVHTTPAHILMRDPRLQIDVYCARDGVIWAISGVLPCDRVRRSGGGVTLALHCGYYLVVATTHLTFVHYTCFHCCTVTCIVTGYSVVWRRVSLGFWDPENNLG